MHTSEKSFEKGPVSGGLSVKGIKKQSLPGRPLVSVVTVVYNRAADLETTLASVVGQTYASQVEYIIIDGGSTDGTLEVIKKNEDRIDYWISEPDKGIYDAMNKAVDLASGVWINFMNCGDRFASPTVLEDVFSEHAYDADLIYGNAMVEYWHFKALFPTHSIDTIWKNSPFCHQACFIRTELMRAYKFDPQYKVGADHHVFYRAYMEKRKFMFVNTLICYFDGKEGTTKKWIFTAVRDKMNLAMRYEPSFGKWLYYKFYLVYLYLLVALKRLMGPGVTGFIARLVKSKKVN